MTSGPSRPAWVVQTLSRILKFDEDTVKEAILPDLESQQSQVKLKSHLQDFLGPSPEAKTFIEKYINHRFPRIPTPSEPPAPTPSLKQSSTKPLNKGTKGNAGRVPYQSTQRPAASGSGGNTPPVELDGSFGPGGKLYQKQRDADQVLFARYSPGGSGSGTNTPQSRHTPSQSHHDAPRSAGFLTVHQVQAKAESSNKKNSQGDKIWDVPRSREVKKLDEIREKLLELQEGNGKVAFAKLVPDCFCQARNHPLSSYTPLCQSCGLILCNIQPVYAPCPSCQHHLLSPAQLSRVLLKIDQDIDVQVAIEQAEREAIERERRERLIAESGGGAFPTLSGGPPRPTPVPFGATAPTASERERQRKVLTLSKGKGKGKGRSGATLTTTTYKPASVSSTAATTPGEPITPPPEDIFPRPRSEPFDPERIAKELNKVLKWREEEDRPWGNMKGDKKGEGWTYVELPIEHFIEEHAEGRRKIQRKKRKGEGKGVDGRVVPGAAA